jgi:hypothetical protein
MPHHLPTVANAVEGADADVESVGQKAKPGKEPQYKSARKTDGRGREPRATGSRVPMIGPAQTTIRGCGFVARSVREIVKG